MNHRKVFLGAAAALLIATVGGTATAHHSYALYDMSKTMSSPAVLKDFHWGAPHSSASFVLKGSNGREQILTLQGAAPALMARAGFNPKDLRRGMKVDITWHPLRNGTAGGTLATIKFPDGRVFTDSEYAFSDGEKQSSPPDAPSSARPKE